MAMSERGVSAREANYLATIAYLRGKIRGLELQLEKERLAAHKRVTVITGKNAKIARLETEMRAMQRGS